MRKILKSLVLLLTLFNISFAFAWTVDHFKVEFTEKSSWIWEALDLTITALDKNDDVVKDHTWSVFGFSQTDDYIELPAELAHNDWYAFKLSDEWVKKFENWVKFKTTWEQSIKIYDSNDYNEITGEWEITIIQSDTTKKTVEIEILTPESNTTLPNNKLKLSGATERNHQVRIKLNNKEEFTTTSNTDWIFEKDIDSLLTWKNILQAFTLDSDENIIWESKEVIINIDDNKPKFKKIVLSPLSESWSIEENTNIEVKVFASKNLRSVKLLFNDWVVNLSETEKWIYTWGFKTPSEEKTFYIDVILLDSLWHTVTEKKATKINVFLVETNSASETDPLPIKNVKENEPDLKIEWLKLIKLKNKSILTWNKVNDAEDYDVFKKNDKTWNFEFLKNVTKTKFEIDITWDKIKYQYFAVKAKTKTASWEVITWDLSEATKIQTWPTEIILMLLLSLILGFVFIVVKRKNA
jgi:hypothetical protein